jgi:sugar phosphate permease
VQREPEISSVRSGIFSRPALRQRWTRILPVVFVTYSLAYVDRANYGFGAAAGLSATLHITESQSALLGALFFLGYFLCQIPGAAFARKRSARQLIFVALLSWGILAALTGIVQNFWLLALDRLLLGASESFIMPGMLLLLTRWFTRAERSRANTLLIAGNPVTVLWMSAVTGYIIRSIGWQKTFIVEGLPSILWAVVWLIVIRDRPEDAAWMDAESREELNSVLQREQAHIPAVANARVALRSPLALCLALQYFLWCVGVYGFVLWLPTIIQQGAARGIAITGLLSSIPYLAAVLLMLLVSVLSDRSGDRAKFIWPSLLIASLALFGSFMTSSFSFTTSFCFLVLAGGLMYAPYGPFFAMIAERLPRNVAAEVTAMVNACGALGSFAGSYAVGLLQARTGNPRAGFLLMSISVLISALLILLLPRLSVRQATTGMDLGPTTVYE